MSRRRLQALRNLAERPGTEAEGIAARAALKRHEAKTPTEEQRWDSFRSYLRTGSDDDLADAIGLRKCHCGAKFKPFESCTDDAEHDRIKAEIERRFPKGTRVYYNYWAYASNCPGVVKGYPRKGFSGDWAWVRVKFDHLKNTLDIRVYSEIGWHLTAHPVDAETLKQTGMRGGMEALEDLGRAAAKAAEAIGRVFSNARQR